MAISFKCGEPPKEYINNLLDIVYEDTSVYRLSIKEIKIDGIIESLSIEINLDKEF